MPYIHINYLPDDEPSEPDYNFDDFDANDPSTWAASSYAGRERQLANLLNDDTMQWYHTMQDYGYDENYNAWALFNMLMMHSAAARAMTDADEVDDENLDKLIAQIQDDATDDSGEYFRVALDYRLHMWRTLQDLASRFRSTSIDDI